MKILTRARAYLRLFAIRFPRTAKFFGFANRRRGPLFALFLLVMHVIGFFMSISAVRDTRTPQGAIAWALSLNTFPIVAVPAYGVFGDSAMDSYIAARSAGLVETRPVAESLIKNLASAEASPGGSSDLMKTIGKLSSLPVTAGNQAELLIDGKNTFDALFEAIETAEKYIIVQFYIFRSDDIGSELKDRLIQKAKEGVEVYVLFDDYGSSGLSSAFVSELREAGAQVKSFMDFGEDMNRFQLNFRNHRKIVVVDGKVGFIGGLNVGDEYLGHHPVLTPWRDSHLRVTGPVVACMQVPFVEDWHWATGEIIADLNWDVVSQKGAAGGTMEAVCVPSGPGDPIETCTLFFLASINAAKERLWIATPYFVPDEGIVLALQLAAKRGVDVKIIIPDMTDDRLVYLSSFSYLKELEQVGVEIWRYEKGFMHQKVMLVDNDFSAIGSANMDNRSFRLNFEAGVAIHDQGFNEQVAAMLKNDLSNSRKAGVDDLAKKSEFFKLSVKVARLLAPVQ